MMSILDSIDYETLKDIHDKVIESMIDHFNKTGYLPPKFALIELPKDNSSAIVFDPMPEDLVYSMQFDIDDGAGLPLLFLAKNVLTDGSEVRALTKIEQNVEPDLVMHINQGLLPAKDGVGTEAVILAYIYSKTGSLAIEHRIDGEEGDPDRPNPNRRCVKSDFPTAETIHEKFVSIDMLISFAEQNASMNRERMH